MANTDQDQMFEDKDKEVDWTAAAVTTPVLFYDLFQKMFKY